MKGESNKVAKAGAETLKASVTTKAPDVEVTDAKSAVVTNAGKAGTSQRDVATGTPPLPSGEPTDEDRKPETVDQAAVTDAMRITALEGAIKRMEEEQTANVGANTPQSGVATANEEVKELLKELRAHRDDAQCAQRVSPELRDEARVWRSVLAEGLRLVLAELGHPAPGGRLREFLSDLECR